MAKTRLQRDWDDIREYLGMCPLYEGAMAEKDMPVPLFETKDSTISFMAGMSQRAHKCKYCNVNREGQHQDYCPSKAA